MTAKKRPIVGKLGADAPARTGETVCVACKAPGGLTIRASEWVEATEDSPAGPRRVRVSRPIVGGEFTLDGLGEYHHLDPNRTYRYDMAVAEHPGAFALTVGVPKWIWDNWAEHNQALIDSGIVFAVPTKDDAVAEAKSRASIRSGLEPLDPDHPERTVTLNNPRNALGAVMPITSV